MRALSHITLIVRAIPPEDSWICLTASRVNTRVVSPPAGLDARDNIGGGFLERERTELATQRHPLLQLPQPREIQAVGQLWLPGEDERQELGRRDLDVCEQTNLFQQLVAETLGLVDHQGCDLSIARGVREGPSR